MSKENSIQTFLDKLVTIDFCIGDKREFCIGKLIRAEDDFLVLENLSGKTQLISVGSIVRIREKLREGADQI